MERTYPGLHPSFANQASYPTMVDPILRSSPLHPGCSPARAPVQASNQGFLRFSISLATLAGAFCMSFSGFSTCPRATAQDIDQSFFETRIRPLLVEHCYSCHSGSSKKIQGGLRLDHRSLMIQGGESGTCLVPGDPTSSPLMQAVRYESMEMPPSGKLAEEKIELLRKWIEAGAPWPDEPVPSVTDPKEEFNLLNRKENHWAWKGNPFLASNAAADQLIPKTNRLSSRGPIDRFINAELLKVGLEPAERAEPITLLRRLYFDLIGIPPTAEQVEEYLQADEQDRFQRTVDQLLSSPQYGVRFGRHWLDLVRYAESRGHEFDEDTPGARHYRDYVVRAFNEDLSYFSFVREQIAGDLDPNPRRNLRAGWNESVLGTGFWHLGEWVHSPVDGRKDQVDRFDNMVDVFSKSFLGLTVACARCHDHKFDAIRSKDYYALYGFLQSSHYRMVRFETEIRDREIASQLHQGRAPFQRRAQKVLADIVRSIQSEPTYEAQFANYSAPGVNAMPVAATHPGIRLDMGRAGEKWRSDGVVYGFEPERAGSIQLDWRSEPNRLSVQPLTAAHRDPFWNPMESTVEAVNRQNRYSQVSDAGKTFSTSTFTLETGKLSYLIRGGVRAFASVDSHRLIAGPLHGEALQDFPASNNEYRWVTHGLDRYRGKRLHIEFSPIDGQPLDIVQVIDGPAPEPTKSEPAPSAQELSMLADWLESLAQGEKGVASKSSIESSRLAQLAGEILTRLDGPLRDHPKAAMWRELISEWKKAELSLAERVQWKSNVAMAMIDGSAEDDFLLIRGNHLNPSEQVHRRFLESLGGLERPIDGEGSGRWELANQIIDPSNPLTARVMANRIWHHLLGRGIVPTTDDFGVLGQRPSHPELLDYLAWRLIQKEGSIKELIREIVMSDVYQRSSHASDPMLQGDPTNQWLARGRVRRLESEAVRDTLLAVSGQLDFQLEGPSVPVHLTDFLQGRGRPSQSGPIDSAGRRSLFIAVRRNFLVPMMTTFDAPNPFSSMGRRNVSNVPAQSLILLNDPFVHQLANRWGQQIGQSPGSDVERVQRMYATAFSRSPSSKEIEASLDFLRSGEDNRWSELAHVLMNRKELIFRY